MDEEINGMIHLSMEILLCALLLSCIVILGGAGHRLYANKVDHNGQTDYMYAKSDLFHYDDKIVTGSDIMELILTRRDELVYWVINDYDSIGTDDWLYHGPLAGNTEIAYAIDMDNDGNPDFTKFDYVAYIDGERYKWSEDTIRKNLGDISTVKYRATIVSDRLNVLENGSASESGVVGVLFVRTGG